MQAGGTKAGTPIQMTRTISDYLRNEVPLLTRMSPEVNKQSLVAYGTRSQNYGVTGRVLALRPHPQPRFGEGTFFSASARFCP